MRRLLLLLVVGLAACDTPQGGEGRSQNAPRAGAAESRPATLRHTIDTETPVDERYMRLAQKAEREGNAELAAVLYRAAALANEKDAAPRAASAALFEKVGEYKPAAGLFSQLAKETDNTDHLLAAGRNMLKAGDYTQAKEHFETAVVKAPMDWRGYNGLAVAYDFLQNHKAAGDNYTLAAEKAPEKMKASVVMNWALSLMLDGNAKEAITKLEALPDAASQPPVRTRLGLAYALDGRTEDAKRLGLVKTPTNDDLQAMLRGGGMRAKDDADHVIAPLKPAELQP